MQTLFNYRKLFQTSKTLIYVCWINSDENKHQEIADNLRKDLWNEGWNLKEKDW
jgi:hypothetical protein